MDNQSIIPIRNLIALMAFATVSLGKKFNVTIA